MNITCISWYTLNILQLHRQKEIIDNPWKKKVLQSTGNTSPIVPKTTIWRHRKRAGSKRAGSKRALWGKSSTSFKAQKHAKPGNVEPDASSSDSCAASVKYMYIVMY